MINNFNKVEEYCENMLSHEDKESFEDELAINSDLRDAVNVYFQHKTLAKGLLEMDILESLSNAKAVYLDTHKTNELAPESKTHKSSMYILWLLLGVILLAFIWYLWPSKENIEASETPDYALVYEEPIWPVVRSDEDTLLQKVMFLFLSENKIEEAKMLILTDTALDSDMKHYWIAEMYLKANQRDSAKLYLPDLDVKHVKYKRVVLLKELLTKKEY